MRDVLFVTIATRCARFILLLASTVAILSPCRARADAFPDTVFFNGFDPCVGVQCFQVHCPAGQTTSVSGTVYAPNGTLPLPNVQIYVPSTAVGALTEGPDYDRCGVAPLGHPIAAALSDANGNFTVTNMPATTNVPVVLLAGKWRRQITVASVPQCTNTALDATDTRLPQNHTEGDIAHIAIVTGSADAVECLVRKTGVADSEFSTNSGSGRIHLYAGPGGGTNKFDVANGGAVFASGSTLWASSATLSAYDQVMLGCDGAPNPGNSIPQTSLDAMQAYADAGGRVYLSHWNNYWVQQTAGWSSIAGWSNQPNPTDPLVAQVANDFPQAFVEYIWLVTTGASTMPGKLPIYGSRQTAISIDANVARRWISATANSQPSIQLFTFTTPVGATPSNQLGRVLFTDMHDYVDSSGTLKPFPSGGCGSAVTALSPQEKALIYATFDLQRCVGSTLE